MAFGCLDMTELDFTEALLPGRHVLLDTGRSLLNFCLLYVGLISCPCHHVIALSMPYCYLAVGMLVYT